MLGIMSCRRFLQLTQPQNNIHMQRIRRYSADRQIISHRNIFIKHTKTSVSRLAIRVIFYYIFIIYFVLEMNN